MLSFQKISKIIKYTRGPKGWARAIRLLGPGPKSAWQGAARHKKGEWANRAREQHTAEPRKLSFKTILGTEIIGIHFRDITFL